MSFFFSSPHSLARRPPVKHAFQRVPFLPGVFLNLFGDDGKAKKQRYGKMVPGAMRSGAPIRHRFWEVKGCKL